MTEPTVPVGQIVELEFTIRDQDGLVVDVSTATEMLLIVKRVNSATVSKVLTNVSDGTDGKVKYITLVTDLDTAGIWRMQARITMDAKVINSSLQTLEVVPNL